jgi:tetratricopeptide (TPR) repeat protein
MDTTAMGFNLNTFAVMLLRAGQNLRALQVIEQDIQARQMSNADGVLDSVLRSNYVSALHAIGRIDQAMPHVERGLKEALSSKEPRKLGEVSLRAAEVLCDTIALARCESLIELSAKNFALYMSPTHPTLARLNLLRAKVAIDRRSPELAREHIARALGIMDKAGKPDGRRVIALGQLAQAELMLGERDLALKHANEAVAYARLHFASFPASRWGGMAQLSLGQVRKERTEIKLATDALQAAKIQLDAALGAASPVALNTTRELMELTALK